MDRLDTFRSYAHCPLKKRPLAYYQANDTDYDEQPQDLSMKRRRHDSGEVCSSPKAVAPLSPHSAAVPSRATTSSPPAAAVSPVSHTLTVPDTSARVPSLADFYLQLFQSTTAQQQQQEQQQQQLQQPLWWGSPMVWPLLHPTATSAAQHPTHPVLAARLASPTPSEEQILASPRSTVSEDSGVGGETLSEEDDEIDVQDYEEGVLVVDEQAEARYSCSDCGKSYSTYSGLSKHKQFHCTSLGAKSFSCKHCHKVYTSLGALKMHIRTHTLPCKCHLCGKAFSRPWLLQGHIRTHTGEKPFNCTQCDRSFADRSNLRAHLQTHADIKKYACTTCHKTFSRMSLLNKHTESACPVRLQQQQQHLQQQHQQQQQQQLEAR